MGGPISTNPGAYRDWHNTPWDTDAEKLPQPRKIFFREGYYTIYEIEAVVQKEREDNVHKESV